MHISCIVDRGIVLAGEGALLEGMDELIKEQPRQELTFLHLNQT